jgi:hydrogenase small subunit
MTPFYKRLPNVPGFGVENTVDKIGAGLAVATAAAFAAHGVISTATKRRSPEERRED